MPTTDIDVKLATSITLDGKEVTMISDPSTGKVLWSKTPWYLDDDYIDSLTSQDIGLIRIVIVNGQPHKVRLISVNRDKMVNLIEGEEHVAHTTWEFADVISDSNGHSLTTFWKNMDGTVGANYDYINSSARKALTGQGNGDLHWFEMSSKKFSTTYANKTVLDMLPQEFKDKLINVKKFVNIYNTSSSKWEETQFEDKLFLPAVYEYGYSDAKVETKNVEPYVYYKDCRRDNDGERSKSQVNTEGTITSPTSGTDVDGAYSGTKTSYAGVHPTSQGDQYIYRTPVQESDNGLWFQYGRYIMPDFNCNAVALPVAPIFCLGVGPKVPKWYERDDWYNFTSQATKDDIGIEVNVYFQDLPIHNQKFRLIGVDHDDLADGSGKAHTTWESVDLFTWEQGMAMPEYFTDDRRVSTYHNMWRDGSYSCSLFGDLYNIMYYYGPQELARKIVNIKKKTSRGIYSSIINELDHNVFCLSAVELTGTTEPTLKEEGAQYEYYKQHPEKLIKNGIGGQPEKYWCRSPYPNSSENAVIIKADGTIDNQYVCEDAGTSVAFCI